MNTRNCKICAYHVCHIDVFCLSNNRALIVRGFLKNSQGENNHMDPVRWFCISWLLLFLRINIGTQEALFFFLLPQSNPTSAGRLAGCCFNLQVLNSHSDPKQRKKGLEREKRRSPEEASPPDALASPSEPHQVRARPGRPSLFPPFQTLHAANRGRGAGIFRVSVRCDLFFFCFRFPP